MNVCEGITRSWLETELIPKLKKKVELLNCPINYEILPPPDSFFLSRVFFLDLKFYKDEEKSELSCEYNFVVKLPTTKKIIFETLRIDYTFYNEILFFTKYAQNSKDYPKCFYTLYTPLYESIIVTENIAKQGYWMCPEKYNLSMKYVLAAVKELGRFHAKGYILKEKQPNHFFQVVKDIRSNLYEKDRKFSRKFFIDVMGIRMANYLRNHNIINRKCDDFLFIKVEPYLMNAYEKIVIMSMEPMEPLAILCHGDFVVNNIFFRERHQNIEVKLLDFGRIAYCSPSYDLTTFLTLNCTQEARTSHFDEIFCAYYKYLIECLEESGIPNLERFSKHNLLEDFKNHALGTYLMNVFFLQVIYNYAGPDLVTLFSMPEKDVFRYYLNVGADEFSKIIVDILLDLREVGCLDFILQKHQ